MLSILRGDEAVKLSRRRPTYQDVRHPRLWLRNVPMPMQQRFDAVTCSTRYGIPAAPLPLAPEAP